MSKASTIKKEILRVKRIKAAWTLRKRKEYSELQKALWKNASKELRTCRLSGVKRNSRSKVYRQQKSNELKLWWAKKSRRNNQSRLMKVYWKDDVWRRETGMPAKVRVCNSPEFRKKQSRRTSRRWREDDGTWARAIIAGAIRAGNSTFGTNIERLVQTALTALRLKFEVHRVVCFTSGGWCVPDVLFLKPRVAVFCDGNYWHGPAKVKKKDKKVTLALRYDGWVVLRFSETLIKTNLKLVVAKILKALGRPK